MAPRIVISLLSWDSEIYTRNILLNFGVIDPGIGCHIHITDQGSRTELRQMVADFVKNRPNASMTQLEENIGYGAGHNLAHKTLSERFEFDYFVTLNNDSLFGRHGWLKHMVEIMDKNLRLGLGGPLAMRRVPGEEEREPPPASTQPFSFISGACVIIREQAIRRIGLFDEVYAPAYWEDTDLAFRYRRYGWGQKLMRTNFLHSYLGREATVSREKLPMLMEKHGDFFARNREIFLARWMEGAPTPAEPDLIRAFPGLYIPKPRS